MLTVQTTPGYLNYFKQANGTSGVQPSATLVMAIPLLKKYSPNIGPTSGNFIWGWPVRFGQSVGFVPFAYDDANGNPIFSWQWKTIGA